MAEPKKPVSRFRPVKAPPPERGYFARNAEGLKTEASGRSETNTGCTRMLIQIAREEGKDPKKFGVAFGVDPATKQISVYVIDPVAEGETHQGERAVSAVREYRGRSNQLGFHLGGVYEEYPALKVNFVRDCKVFRYNDAGTPCMVIDLATAVPYVARKKKATTAKAKPKPEETKKQPPQEEGQESEGNAAPGA